MSFPAELRAADHLARDLLLDSGDATRTRGVFLGWGAVVESATRLWDATGTRGANPIQHLRNARSSLMSDATASWLRQPETTMRDDQVQQIADLFARVKHPPKSQTEVVRASVLHTVAVLTHATRLNVLGWARLHSSGRIKVAEDRRNQAREVASRLKDLEQVLDVAMHSPLAPARPGREHLTSRHLSNWNRVCQNALAAAPVGKSAGVLYMMAETQLGLMSRTCQLLATNEVGLDPHDWRRLGIAATNSVRAWGQTRDACRILAGAYTPPLELSVATSELSATLSTLTPQDLPALVNGLATGPEVAALIRRDLNTPGLRVDTFQAEKLVSHLTRHLVTDAGEAYHEDLRNQVLAHRGEPTIELFAPLRKELDSVLSANYDAAHTAAGTAYPLIPTHNTAVTLVAPSSAPGRPMTRHQNPTRTR